MQSEISHWRVPGRLAYIANQSYPYSSSGYAVRTHGVALGLQRRGQSVIVINRPGSPWDSGVNRAPRSIHQREIDGVRYLFVPRPLQQASCQYTRQKWAVDNLQRMLALFKPSAVMAASNWENAYPALQAARALELPFFYEVRGFWELTRASLEPEWHASDDFYRIVDQETLIANESDHVFTLNTFMKAELVRRGVKPEKISLVPNAWPCLPDAVPDTAVRRDGLHLNSRYVIGYIGTFNDYEGLEDLIRASGELVKSGLDLKLLLVGSDSQAGWLGQECLKAKTLRVLAQHAGLGDRLLIHDRVSQQEVTNYYALLDLVVIPRRSLPVTELVSPIKPLEAAACGCPLLLSDVAPLKEFASESGAATFRKDDFTDLKDQIASLLDDKRRRLEMGQHLRCQVKERWLFPEIVIPIQEQVAAFSGPSRLSSLPKNLKSV